MVKQNLIIIFVFIAFFVKNAEAAIRINITYTMVSTEELPQQKTRVDPGHHLELILDHNRITLFSPNGRYVVSGEIGQPLEMPNGWGADFVRIFKYKGNTLVEDMRDVGYSMHTAISSLGNNQCTASVSYKKLPGQKFFLPLRNRDNQVMYVSDMHVEDMVCQVSAVETN